MLRLIGTPLSHFTRKIRILLSELGVDHVFDRARSVLATDPAAFGNNPLRRVPTLVTERGEMLIESDHIARHVVTTYDPPDRFGVRSDDIADLNGLAVINGVMDNEVVLILAKRAGTEIDAVPYFRKLATCIDEGLAWLERETDVERAGFDYRDIALVCLWQHVVHYQSAPGLDRYPKIAARVARFAGRASVASTAPVAALAEAAAAGWTPG